MYDMVNVKKRVLFLIHDLGQGGAEKVLVNLVNNLNFSIFDVTVMTLFDCGVNKQFLSPKVHYRYWKRKMIPGNSHWMKIFSPEYLHKIIVRDEYDIEVSYLEGPSARVISGCKNPNTKLVSWIHCTLHSEKEIAASFRSFKEAKKCYSSFNDMVFVSKDSMNAFEKICSLQNRKTVCYNTNESTKIIEQSNVKLENGEILSSKSFKWCGIGKLVPLKAFDRMIRIQKRLIEEGYDTHFYALGMGSQLDELERLSKELGIQESVTFLGYQTNPYNYLKHMDLFVCASYSEGFSTATTESLIVGVPVCSVEVSGMKEMLGNNNEYGIITKNDEHELFLGIKRLLDSPDLLYKYKIAAKERGKLFTIEKTVKSVEELLLNKKEKSDELD